MRIILARHGKPNLCCSRSVAPCEMEKWIETYNDAEVMLEAVPPKTVETAHASGIIVASRLRRSMQSAQYLSNGEAVLSEQIFCEAELPYFRWHLPKLPASAWAAFFRVAWFLGYSANAESVEKAKARAQAAAERLIHLANEYDSIFLVGHGIMIALIAKHLLALGWVGPARPAHDYWQFSTYHPAACRRRMILSRSSSASTASAMRSIPCSRANPTSKTSGSDQPAPPARQTDLPE